MSETTPAGRFAHRRYGAGDGSGAERRRGPLERAARRSRMGGRFRRRVGVARLAGTAGTDLAARSRMEHRHPHDGRSSWRGGADAPPQHRRRRRGRRLDRAVGRRRARGTRARAAECVHSASLLRRHARRVAHAGREHRRGVPGARAGIAAQPASPRTRTRPGVRLGCRSRRRADEDRSRRRLAGRTRGARRRRPGRAGAARERDLGRRRRGDQDVRGRATAR